VAPPPDAGTHRAPEAQRTRARSAFIQFEEIAGAQYVHANRAGVLERLLPKNVDSAVMRSRTPVDARRIKKCRINRSRASP
jgi:hypothetical protein